MERREAVKYISILLGGTLVGAEAFLSGCRSSTAKPGEWTPEDLAFLNEVGETILPQTSTPGAKAANVGQFMSVMVNDCYEEGDQKAFREGMDKLQQESKKRFDRDFLKATPEQRKELLTALDKEARDYQQKVNEFNQKENDKEKQETARGNQGYKKQRMSPHYFALMKQLTLLGYFTSEVGATKALRYNPVPGRYEGCIPYKKGDRAWA